MNRTAPAQRDKSSKSRTRADDLARALADDIINGRVFPGTRLDETSLASRFDDSRTPVREALSQLTSMGLVEKQPHRGVIVANISPETLHGMFEVMADLEALCAQYAAERMSAEERENLAALHRASKSLVSEEGVEDYAALNTQFHSAIYKGAQNDYLEELAMMTRRRLSPFRRAQFRMSGRMEHSFDEHDAVVSAILAGDGTAAAKAMRDHVLTVSAATAAYMVSHGDH